MQRKEPPEVSAGARGADHPGLERGDPLETPGGELEPGPRIHLDDVRRSAAGVAGARDDLDGAVRRDPDLDRAARCPLLEELQRPAHRRRDDRPRRPVILEGGREGGETLREVDPLPGHPPILPRPRVLTRTCR